MENPATPTMMHGSFSSHGPTPPPYIAPDPSSPYSDMPACQQQHFPAPLSPNALASHVGEHGMVVVDPMTRKLAIPWHAIYETRAQLRTSIPSLCQLFLQGRCRQAINCHQVHADPIVVEQLRKQVQTLPMCCAIHGDVDHSEGPNDTRAILVTNLQWNEGVIPIHRLSRTHGLDRILEANHTTTVGNGQQRVITANGSYSNICRLHVLDRCRFAEDCKFLHVCKHIAYSDPLFQAVSPHQGPYSSSYSGSHVATPFRGAAGGNAVMMMPPSPVFMPTSVYEMPQVLNISGEQRSNTPPSPPTPVSPGESTPNASSNRSFSRRYSANGNEWSHEPYRMWESLSQSLVEAK